MLICNDGYQSQLLVYECNTAKTFEKASMASCPVVLKMISVVAKFIWTITAGSLAIDKLRNVHDDFVDILDAIPNPQVRIINDDQFLGPVHIICSQPLLNSTSVTCDDIFNRYDPITGTQLGQKTVQVYVAKYKS